MENIINELTIDDTPETPNEEKTDDMRNRIDDKIETDSTDVENHRTVSEIMHELQKELKQPNVEVINFYLQKYHDLIEI